MTRSMVAWPAASPGSGTLTVQSPSGRVTEKVPWESVVAVRGPKRSERGVSVTETFASGSPLTAAAQGELAKTLAGGYLDPAASPAFQKAARDIQARIGGMYAAAGRYGSGAMANQANEALSTLAAQTYGQERENMMRGLLFAPQLAQQDYFDVAKLAEVGGAREDLQQQLIDEAVARHNFAQTEPWQRLALYNQLIQGNYGGQSSTTTTTMPRRAVGSGLLDGATSGASLGMMFGPWGGLAGAGIGGLLSLLD